MTPYEEGKKVIIDPELNFKELTFGPLDRKDYEGLIGSVEKMHYMAVKRTMTYLVKFSEDVFHWFTEKEIG